METKQYLISICIPTYNRASYLKKCLDSLVCQPEFVAGKVEIVISDNASTDNTEELVKEYREKYGNIIYHRNLYNVGTINGDQNFAIAMQMGHGILRKLGGDTRLYKQGSLAYLCNAAQKYQMEKPVLYFSNGNDRAYTSEEEVFTDINHFLKRASFMLTWMDTFYLWEDDAADLLAYAKNSTSGFWFVEKFMELAQKKKIIIYFKQNIITGMNVEKKDVSYGIVTVFYDNFLGIFKPLVNNKIITKACFEGIEKDLLFGFFIYFILEWELRNRHYKFSETENLKEAVFLRYHEKEYLKEFHKEYMKAKIKFRLKCIPILGPLLVEIKHKIREKR